MAKQDEVQLGDIVKDTITGFKGVAIGITRWLHGCRRITVQPEGMKDGKPLDTSCFDEPQISVVKTLKHATSHRTGGPGPVSTKRADATRR